jgi:oligopeptidase B
MLNQTPPNKPIPQDNNIWMHDKTSDKMTTFIARENADTAAALKDTQALSQQIASEILSRLDMSRQTPPSTHGEYEYYLRDVKGHSRPLHCRSKAGVEEVIFDENNVASLFNSDNNANEHAPVDVKCLGTSPDQRYWVLAIDQAGDERYQLWIKDLINGEFIAHSECNLFAQIAWIDNDHFICLQLNKRNRPCKALQYSTKQLFKGFDQKHALLLFDETDESYSLSICRAASGCYVFLTVSRLQDSNEVHILSSEDAASGFRCFAERRSGIRYQLTHHGDSFYVLGNADGINKSLYRVTTDDQHQQHKTCLYQPHLSRELIRLQAFGKYLVLYQRDGQQTQMVVINPLTLDAYPIELPEPNYVLSYADNLDHDCNSLRFFYTSLVTPDTLYRFDMCRRKLFVEDSLEVEGYNADQYHCEYLMVETTNKVKVPVSLVYKKSLKNPDGNPLLLYGYGAYGYSLPADFTSLRVSLLDRGFIYAIAHVRGGGELGPDWHHQGKRHNKQNSFIDFTHCAGFLKSNGYTTTEKLAVMGESAGGLLVTAAVNQDPELCAALVAINPFVDVFNTLSDSQLPGTTEEWVEWGDPANEQDRETILAYSPYENIRPGHWPDMLLTCSLNDAQVPYWEACKFKQRIQHNNMGDSEILLHIREDLGHQGTMDRYTYIEREANLYAWLVSKVG